MHSWRAVRCSSSDSRGLLHLGSTGSSGALFQGQADCWRRGPSDSYCAGVGWTRYRRRLTTERKRGFGSHPAISEQFDRPESCVRVATRTSLSVTVVPLHARSGRSLRSKRSVPVGVGFRPAPAVCHFRACFDYDQTLAPRPNHHAQGGPGTNEE